MSNTLKFEVVKHYYAIEVGCDVYPQKKGMIDVVVNHNNTNVAVVSFNENIPNGTVFWQIDFIPVDYYQKITDCKDQIIALSADYLRTRELNYD